MCVEKDILMNLDNGDVVNTISIKTDRLKNLPQY